MIKLKHEKLIILIKVDKFALRREHEKKCMDHAQIIDVSGITGYCDRENITVVVYNCNKATFKGIIINKK